MIESMIGGIAVPIFEQVWKAGGFAVNEVKKSYSQTQAIQKVIAALKQYVKKYEDRHCQIKIMPGLMKEPLPLELIYTAVKLLDDQNKHLFVSQDSMEQAYREAGRRGLNIGNNERLDGIDIANTTQFLMVLGGPGVGKSTFLRKLGLESLKREGQLQRECVPVFIDLKEFKEETLDLKQAIAQEFETCGFPAATDFTASMLDQGKLLLLLDGLDEVPTHNFIHVIEHIEDFVDQYDQNYFVTSCRIAAYRTSFRRFTDVIIAEFNDTQIEQFIQRWFNSELDQREETAQKYWALLKRVENKATKELAQTPLLLVFLCLVYDREQALPSVRSDLYGSALNILLKDWAAQKRLERDPIYEGFHPGLEKLLLANIAHGSFVRDQLFFSKNNIINRIAEYLADTLDAPKHLNGDKVLTAIEVQQGILVKRTANTYSFSHLTLQEYLTAFHIVKKRRAHDLVTEHLIDSRWREVFLLVAGLMEDEVHELLIAIDQQSQTYISKYPKLCNLINWSNTIINSAPGPHKLITRRAAALSYCSSVATAIAITRANDSNGIMSVARVSDRASASSRAIAIVTSLANASISDKFRAIASNLASDLDSARASAIANDKAIVSDIARASARALTKTRNSNLARDIANDITRAIKVTSTLIENQFFKIEKINKIPSQLSRMKQLIPGEEDSSENWHQWVVQLESIWLEAMEIDAKALTFSTVEAKALGDYLYANELLILCKNSAVRVSRKAWESLETKLLTLH